MANSSPPHQNKQKKWTKENNNNNKKRQEGSTRVQATRRIWVGFGDGKVLSYNKQWRQLYLGSDSRWRLLVGTQNPVSYTASSASSDLEWPPSPPHSPRPSPQNCQKRRLSATSLRGSAVENRSNAGHTSASVDALQTASISFLVFCLLSYQTRVMNSGRMIWTEHVACMKKWEINTNICSYIPNKLYVVHSNRFEGDVKEMEYKCMVWIQLTWYRVLFGVVVSTVKNLRFL